MADSMPFQQHHEARTTLPLAEILTDRYFMPVRDNLRAGDQIALCRYANAPGAHHDARLVEFAVVRVVEKSREAVRLLVVTPVVQVGTAAVEGALSAPAPASAEQYVVGDGHAVWRGGPRKWGVNVGGEIVCEGLGKEEAEAIARGDAPLPARKEPEAA